MRRSAGLLPHRRAPDGTLEVLLGHMGGPFWARKDEAAWSIVKGEHLADEEPFAAALREWVEETGWPPPAGPFAALGEVRAARDKLLVAWAVALDVDPATLEPGTFELEWPPRSGRVQAFPELDRAAWFDLPTAEAKLVKGQRGLLARLKDALEQPTT